MKQGLARNERQALCATLETLSDEQWAAETCCEGWDAGDVAAHLIVRERDLFAAPGIVVGGPLGALTERRRQQRRAQPRERLLATLREGPPLWVRAGPLDGVQAVEDWIHHEDVRRGRARLEPHLAGADLQPALWQAIERYAALIFGRLPLDARLQFTDGEHSPTLAVRRSLPVAWKTKAAPHAVIEGPVGELVLYVTGRPADVTVTGEERVHRALASGARNV